MEDLRCKKVWEGGKKAKYVGKSIKTLLLWYNNNSILKNFKNSMPATTLRHSDLIYLRHLGIDILKSHPT